MQNLPDIVGAGTVIQFASPNITARWIQIVASGAGTIRFGGPLVSATLGLPVPAGAGMFLPVQTADGQSTSPYSLAGLYAYVPVGATLSIGYEPFG